MAVTSVLNGTVVRTTVLFRNVDGDVGDPTGPITVTFKKPDDTLVAYEYGVDAELVRTGTGAYYCDYDTDVVGTWWVEWEGVEIVEDGYFIVREGNVP